MTVQYLGCVREAGVVLSSYVPVAEFQSVATVFAVLYSLVCVLCSCQLPLQVT